MSRVCSPHKFLFVTSCVVYSRLGSGEDESFSSGRRQFSLACPAVLYQAGCSSLSRLRSEQSAISPCKAAELNCSEETKKKKEKENTFFWWNIFSAGNKKQCVCEAGKHNDAATGSLRLILILTDILMYSSPHEEVLTEQVIRLCSGLTVAV